MAARGRARDPGEDRLLGQHQVHPADTPHELNDAVQTVLHEHTTRADQRHERGDTEGERRVRIYLDTFPLPRDD